ncbi:MAG: holo-ACP synthase [Myxococcota bacterium]
MIVGVGLDLCEVARVRRILERRGRDFMDRVLTPDERAYCERRRDPAVPFAGRFAAKEATIKALAAPKGLRWHDMVVEPAEGVPPRLALHGVAEAAATRMGVVRTHLTITHDGGLAAAVVILEAEA